MTTFTNENHSAPGADNTSVCDSGDRPSPFGGRAFPVDCLPQPIERFIRAGSKALGCDTTFLAVSALTIAAGLIGATRRVRAKSSWTEPAMLWTCIIAPSGSMKTPSMQIALGPVEELDRNAYENYQEALANFEEARETWKQSGADGPPAKAPAPPEEERILIDDVTTEALCDVLKSNPRGLLCAADELTGWFGAFSRYGASKNGSASQWLKIHSGTQLRIDRKSGQERSICIQHPAVCLLGGIQPDLLQKVLSPDMRASGLAARFLFVHPPQQPKRWTEEELPEEVRQQYAEVLKGLHAMHMDIDNDGRPCPVVIPLSPPAKEVFIQFYDEHAREAERLRDALKPVWAKLEGCCLRFALVIHCLRQAAGEDVGDAIDERSMRDAVHLLRWFAHEARRVYATLDEQGRLHELADVLTFIEDKGGSASLRDIIRGLSRYRDKGDEAERDLRRLEQMGFGELVYPSPGKSGGRPSQVFRLVNRDLGYADAA